ncbi:hypothetical protein F0562_034323 [Nyssa sinensis]|uniref:BHLH domain-containing protein n=1 Tax=Nyssa sinensis TaxID=561372 RepID=A0A5J5AJB7_9ASTE|nr:hypothetical protein F0562_034323 [Nyssa sinensis]
MQSGSSSSSKLERNAMEKKRRMEMKVQFSKLAFLISTEQTSKKRMPPDVLLDKATSYVKQLKENVEQLKQRKEDMAGGSMLPVLALREHMDSTLEVNLITELNKNFMLYAVIGVLEEEGADVVGASYSTVGNKIFYTIHSQAAAR